MALADRLNELTKNIPQGCTLIAVSKTQPVDRIREAYTWGLRVFGENRVQELVPKFEALPKDISWHLIGHLQTNKVKHIAPFVSLIHSVDSIKLLEEINKQAAKIERVIPCLLQVHIAEEETKFGFSEPEIIEFLSGPAGHTLTSVRIQGLMGMATFTENQAQVRKEFRGLKVLFDKLKSTRLPDTVSMRELSMGMSSDYKIALEEGSTMIRVGTAIFGERDKVVKTG